MANDLKGAESNGFYTQTMLWKPDQPTPLTEEQERLKKEIYDRLRPARRKFIDKIGYDQWDPFQAPKEPLDLRRDQTNRTLQELVRDFMRDVDGQSKDQAWKNGALECALGIFKKDDRFQGIFDFCLWYNRLIQKEGNQNERSLQ